MFILTQAGPPPGQPSGPALQADHSALEGSGGPGGRRHLGAHVRVRAGIRSPDRAHQSTSVLVRPGPGPQHQRALVARLPARVAADGRAVRVGEAVRRVRAAGGEGRAVRGALGPAVGPPVGPAEPVGLVGGVAGLQVGQHGRDSGGRDVDRRAGRGVEVVPGVIVGLGQTLIHVHSGSVLVSDLRIQN